MWQRKLHLHVRGVQWDPQLPRRLRRDGSDVRGTAPALLEALLQLQLRSVCDRYSGLQRGQRVRRWLRRDRAALRHRGRRARVQSQATRQLSVSAVGDRARAAL